MTGSAAHVDWRPDDTFAFRLLLARKQVGLTLREASMLCNVHPATWSTWERGTIPANMAEVVTKVSAGLGCNRDWLLWGGPLEPGA